MKKKERDDIIYDIILASQYIPVDKDDPWPIMNPQDKWFCRNDFKIYYSDALFAEYGFETRDEIIDSGLFVLLPKVDIVKMEKEFLVSLNSRPINKFLKENEGLSGRRFDAEFKYFFDYDDTGREMWCDYFKEKIGKIVEEWCIENNIWF